MSARAADWFAQAKHDFRHAGAACDSGDFEWACFAAQQSAGKVLKAVYQKRGAEAWGHSVMALVRDLPESLSPSANLLNAGRELDRHYIPARYPNAYPQGAPHEYYTREDDEEAIAYARQILGFCEDHLV